MDVDINAEWNRKWLDEMSLFPKRELVHGPSRQRCETCSQWKGRRTVSRETSTICRAHSGPGPGHRGAGRAWETASWSTGDVDGPRHPGRAEDGLAHRRPRGALDTTDSCTSDTSDNCTSRDCSFHVKHPCSYEGMPRSCRQCRRPLPLVRTKRRQASPRRDRALLLCSAAAFGRRTPQEKCGSIGKG